MRLSTLSLGGIGRWPRDEAGSRALAQALGKGSLKCLSVNMPFRSSLTLTRALLGGLAPLEKLFIQSGGRDKQTVEFLTHEPVATHLKACGLSNMTPDSVHALACGPGLPHVRSLYLGVVWDEPHPALPEAIRAILDAETLPLLASFSLGDHRPWLPSSAGHARQGGSIADSVARAIAGCSGASRLQELNLGGMMDPLGRDAVRALTESPNLSNLRLLQVDVAEADRESRTLLLEKFGRRAKLNGLYEPW
jgi:hypothetical protein